MITDVGETWSSPEYRVLDVSGNPGDASTVTAVVTLPDGTAGAPLTLDHLGVGLYGLDYTNGGTEGRYDVLVTATGGVLGTTVRKWRSSFVVWAAQTLVSTSDALAHLAAQDTLVEADDLEQLRWLCWVATDAIEKDLGRVLVRRSFTDVQDSGRGSYVLRKYPVQSITSVSEDYGAGGVVMDPTFYRATGGVLNLRSYSRRSVSSAWGAWGRTTITYVAGDPVPPPVACEVALYVISRMWQTSQQKPHPGFDSGGGPDASTYAQEALRNKPSELVRAYDSLRTVTIA